MPFKIKTFAASALVLLAAVAKPALAQDGPALEAGLLDAMRYDAKRMERVASGPALQGYIRAGYVDLKPSMRADYTDYRLLKKPASLMGHPLVLIEEEYMTAYLGCCVSEGVGATVRIAGDTAKLKAFAERNACGYEEGVDPGAELKRLGVANDLPKGRYASLSCRERDSQR